MGRARVGPVIREEATDVTSQVVKSTKQCLLLCIFTNDIRSLLTEQKLLWGVKVELKK